MLEYIILTGIANIIINFWLLYIVEEPRTCEFANNFGLISFYVISFCIGCAMIPIIILMSIGAFLRK